MEFDVEKSQEMIGKYVLVGVSRRDMNGEVSELEEAHGVVLRVSEDEGVIIERPNTGEEFILPPFLDSYENAASGVYKLKSVNEEAENPDYIATFDVYPPGYGE